MKAFFWSVIGAVVSAALIYFVNEYLEGASNRGKFRVEYDISSTVFRIDKPDLNKIVSGLGSYGDGAKFAVISVTNVGSEPLTDQTAVIRASAVSSVSGGILAVSSLEEPGDDPEGVGIKFNKDEAQITYKLLNPEESHKFLLAYDAYGEPSLTMRRPGLSLEEQKEQSGSEWDLGDFIILAGVGIIIFAIGAAAMYSSLKTELKDRGHDLDDIIKQPKLSSQPPP